MAGLMWLITAPVLAAPRIELEMDDWDAGRMYVNQSQEKIIRIFNTGDEDLTLFSIDRDCGGTVSLRTPYTIRPDRKVFVKITFEAGQSLGEKTRKLVIRSNDPERSEVVFKMRGTVVADLLPEPQYVFLEDAKPGSMVERTIRLTRPGDLPVGVVEVLPSNNMIQAALSGASSGDQLLHLRIRIPEVIGLMDERVILLTDSPQQKEVIVPVRGLVKGDISLSPNHLYFKIIEPDEPVEEVIAVENTGDDPVEIESIESDIQNLDLQIRVIDSGRSYSVTARLEPPFEIGRIKGAIMLQTNHPFQRHITIPVRGYVKAHSSKE
ncbi:DUF1573 domain-containing protein [bacterium]|nr:DUF1573 domain-containing protein [candidate division CSSED10-310 bacterium]